MPNRYSDTLSAASFAELMTGFANAVKNKFKLCCLNEVNSWRRSKTDRWSDQVKFVSDLTLQRRQNPAATPVHVGLAGEEYPILLHHGLDVGVGWIKS